MEKQGKFPCSIFYLFLTLSKLWFQLLHKYLINQLTGFVDLYTARRFNLIACATALSLIREKQLEYVVVVVVSVHVDHFVGYNLV